MSFNKFMSEFIGVLSDYLGHFCQSIKQNFIAQDFFISMA